MGFAFIGGPGLVYTIGIGAVFIILPAIVGVTKTLAKEWGRYKVNAPGVGAPVEQHLLEGVGHAWSGGLVAGSYTAPDGSDATGIILAFFRRVGVLGR